MSFFSRLVKFGGRTLKGIGTGMDPISAALNATHPAALKTLDTVSRTIPSWQGQSGQAVGQNMQIAGLPMILPGAGAIARGAGAVIARGAARGAGAMVRGMTKQGFARFSKSAARLAGYTIIGQWIYDQAGNLVGQAPARRMNPLNHRALSRACRRIKSAKKILKKVERLTGGTHQRRACAPKRARKVC